MRLPFKESHPLIHDNFELCERSLLNVHEALKDDLLEAYNDIFVEQKQARIIDEVFNLGKLGETHYILHYPVIRDDKTITNIRILFDASSRDSRPNLNHC